MEISHGPTLRQTSGTLTYGPRRDLSPIHVQPKFHPAHRTATEAPHEKSAPAGGPGRDRRTQPWPAGHPSGPRGDVHSIPVRLAVTGRIGHHARTTGDPGRPQAGQVHRSASGGRADDDRVVKDGGEPQRHAHHHRQLTGRPHRAGRRLGGPRPDAAPERERRDQSGRHPGLALAVGRRLRSGRYDHHRRWRETGRHRPVHAASPDSLRRHSGLLQRATGCRPARHRAQQRRVAGRHRGQDRGRGRRSAPEHAALPRIPHRPDAGNRPGRQHQLQGHRRQGALPSAHPTAVGLHRRACRAVSPQRNRHGAALPDSHHAEHPVHFGVEHCGPRRHRSHRPHRRAGNQRRNRPDTGCRHLRQGHRPLVPGPDHRRRQQGSRRHPGTGVPPRRQVLQHCRPRPRRRLLRLHQRLQPLPQHRP